MKKINNLAKSASRRKVYLPKGTAGSVNHKPKINSDIIQYRKFLRQAVADYMSSEGCSCCQNIPVHKIHEERLAKLLKVTKYKDGSGYNFSKFKTK